MIKNLFQIGPNLVHSQDWQVNVKQRRDSTGRFSTSTLRTKTKTFFIKVTLLHAFYTLFHVFSLILSLSQRTSIFVQKKLKETFLIYTILTTNLPSFLDFEKNLVFSKNTFMLTMVFFVINA